MRVTHERGGDGLRDVITGHHSDDKGLKRGKHNRMKSFANAVGAH